MFIDIWVKKIAELAESHKRVLVVTANVEALHSGVAKLINDGVGNVCDGVEFCKQDDYKWVDDADAIVITSPAQHLRVDLISRFPSAQVWCWYGSAWFELPHDVATLADAMPDELQLLLNAARFSAMDKMAEVAMELAVIAFKNGCADSTAKLSVAKFLRTFADHQRTKSESPSAK